MRLRIPSTIFLLLSSFGCAYAQAQTNTVSIDKPLQIPEHTLQPGSYTFALEDRMADRAVLKVSDSSGKHYLVLMVPQPKSTPANDSNLTYWPAGEDNVRAARSWYCDSCGSWYEFVYPKAEAVAIAKRTDAPVIAVDPQSDKIIAQNLTADDLKVVTLWLLSPYKLASGATDLKAAHYSKSAPPQELAQKAEPSPLPGKLPKTATNNTAIGLLGLLLMLASVAPLDLRKARSVLG